MAKSETYVQCPNGDVLTTSNPENWKDCKVLPRKEGEKLYREQACKRLRKLLKPGSTVYTILRSVSKSGMSRKLSLVIPQKDGTIRDITYTAAVAMNCTTDGNGYITRGGCGMDMGFDTVYNLGYYLWPKGTKKPHGDRNGTPDHSGGYALKHSWL
jgi:hypothetical protein